MRLSEIINEVLSDERKVKAIGESGRRIVREKYSWDVVVKSLIRLYESLI